MTKTSFAAVTSPSAVPSTDGTDGENVRRVRIPEFSSRSSAPASTGSSTTHRSGLVGASRRPEIQTNTNVPVTAKVSV